MIQLHNRSSEVGSPPYQEYWFESGVSFPRILLAKYYRYYTYNKRGKKTYEKWYCPVAVLVAK